jgi:hypothetical protein
MKWIILLSLVISNTLATDSKLDDYYDFLQPLIVNLDENQSQDTTNRGKSLSRFTSLATIAPKSKTFYSLNYKLMQEFQYLHFHMKINDNINITQKRELFIRDKNLFIKTLTSIEEPSFFTLYSKLYLETLDSKRLKHKELMKLYSLTSKEKQPYVQLLSYVDSLNQLNSISIIEQNNLHKKLILLLIGLPKKQQAYILRLTALQLQPLYDKKSIEFEFNKLFAQKSTIKREDVLHILNFKDADIVNDYIMKERRSFFEERVFKTNMNALKRNDIAMILAKLYLQKDKFDEARSYIRQAPRSNLYSKYNPFSSSVELDNKRFYKKSSSFRKFAETMSRLKKRLDKGSDKARDFYLYGNGLYNKSFFGNFPMSSVFFHNSNIDKDSIPPTTNLTKAYNAYESALQISTKEEFKAEIAYQMLKIKFQMAIINKKNYPRSMHKIPKTDETKKVKHLLIESRSFIETMQDYKLDYAHTKYGKRVIKESIIFSYL